MKRILLSLLFLCTYALGQTSSLAPSPCLTFFDTNGHALAGGKVYSYIAATTTPLDTYSDSSLTFANTNPVILDSSGVGCIWLTGAAYKFVIKTSTDAQIRTVDNVVGWVDLATTQTVNGDKTFTGNTTFSGATTLAGVTTVTGDFTATQGQNTIKRAWAVNGTLYVGEGITHWGGSDIGAQINQAYSALPSSGGRIVIVPKADGSNYDYATPILLTGLGKYVLLEYEGASGLITAGTPGVWFGCLNYTPITSTNALVLDYATSSTVSASSVHGLRNICIVNNNNAAQSAGASSFATGIAIGNTNHGAAYATMENVTIAGFATNFLNTNFNSSNMTWLNPSIWFGNTGWSLGNVAGTHIFGGNFQANSTAIASTGDNRPEIDVHGTTFVAHPTLTFDFLSVVTCCARLDLYGPHVENGSSTSAAAHFIDGKVDVFISGGLAEDDSTSGTSDYWFNAVGNKFEVQGLQLTTNSRNPSVGVFQANTTTRLRLSPFINNPATLTNICGGTGCARGTLQILNGSISNAALDFQYESRLKSPRFVHTGTALITGDFGTLTNWGTGAAASSPVGSDGAYRITITAGTGPADPASFTLTFHDGTWTNAPVCSTRLIANSEATSQFASAITDVPTATTNVVTFYGLPVATKTYTFAGICVGKPN